MAWLPIGGTVSDTEPPIPWHGLLDGEASVLPSPRQALEDRHPLAGVRGQWIDDGRAAAAEGDGAGGAGGEGLDVVGDDEGCRAGGDAAVDPGEDVVAGAAVHGLERLVHQEVAGLADERRRQDRFAPL